MPPPPGVAAPARRRVGVGLGLLAAVGLFVGGIELARRSAGWFRPAPVAAFRVVVPAGDAVVRRGDPVTLSAYLDPTSPDVHLPTVIELVTRPGPGEPESRRRMTPDPGTGAVVVALAPVGADFEYRVEAGPAASDWFAVRVADPVELAPGTTIDLAPPAYAAAAVAARTVAGFTDLDAVTGGTAAVRLRFTRPAASAVLEWRPDAPGGLPETLAVTLTADGTGGTATVPLREPGGLRLVLTNEPGVRKVRTEATARVRVRPDDPPRVESIGGLSAAPRAVRPGQLVTVTVTLADDVGVVSADLEVAGGPGFGTITRVPLALTGAGTPVAEGKATFDPGTLAGAGAKLRVRVRAADARPGAAPTTYPPDGWAEWTVTPDAPPPDAQEAFGPRDAVASRLTAGLAGLRDAAKAAAAILPATGAKGALSVDHAARLADARAKAKAAAAALRDAAREATLAPHLRPLADSVRSIADALIAEADDFLRRAATDDSVERRAAAEAAVVRLRQAADRVENLDRMNAVLARARLDADRLAALAAAYTALADRAAAGAPAAEVTAERDRLAARFAAVMADSESLRSAAAAAAGAERRDLADRAAALAAAVHDLDATADRLAADVRAAVGAELAAGQAAVADRAAAVLGAIATPARVGRVALPDPATARAAAVLLAAGRRTEVLTELEKFAQSLDRAADAFDQHPPDGSDGKTTARTLARWQDDVRERAAGFAALPDAAKAALRAEQRALAAAPARLTLPPDPALAQLREAAGVHLGMAARRLDADEADAAQPMRLAADALNKLADQTPTAADRVSRGRGDLDRLRADHDAAATAVDSALRQFDKQSPDETVRRSIVGRVAPLVVQYDALAARVAALDLPGHAARQRTAVAVLRTAAADMRAGLLFDVPAAVAAVRRALDRLREAVYGQIPADAIADDLFRLQARIAARPAPNLDAQVRITKGLAALAVSGAPTLFHDATRRVEATKDGTVRTRRAAADALAALADRLTGRRPDAERIVAFAAARSRAVVVALKHAGQPLRTEVSNEEKAQLGREVEELGHVRVGPAGQVPKWRVLVLYSRLLKLTEPDRDAAGQAQLAEALAELAAASAGVADVIPTGPPPEPDPAAAFLPSPRLAVPLRELAREQRAVRDRANAAVAVVASRLRPSDGTAFEELERRQRELAAVAPTVPAAGLAADRLRVGDARTAAEAAAQAVAALRPLDPALAEKQSAILAEMPALKGNSCAAAARHAARARALGRDVDDLTAALAATPDQPDPDALRAAAELARQAARLLAAAADKTDAADAAGSHQARGEAEAALTKAGAEIGPGAADVGGPGRALRAAARPTAPSADALRRTAAALAAAARAVPFPAP